MLPADVSIASRLISYVRFSADSVPSSILIGFLSLRLSAIIEDFSVVKLHVRGFEGSRCRLFVGASDEKRTLNLRTLAPFFIRRVFDRISPRRYRVNTDRSPLSTRD